MDAALREARVFSAHAEVVPKGWGDIGRPYRILRARGGSSLVRAALRLTRKYSPRTRR